MKGLTEVKCPNGKGVEFLFDSDCDICRTHLKNLLKQPVKSNAIVVKLLPDTNSCGIVTHFHIEVRTLV